MVHEFKIKKRGKHKKGVNVHRFGRHLGEDRIISQGKYHSMEVKDGEYNFTLGNFSDAGWFWKGKTDQAWSFFQRIRNSKVSDEFIKDIDQKEFELFKEVLKKQLEKGDYGLYELSGDNAEWHFGENEWIDYDTEYAELKEKFNLTDEQIEKLSDAVSYLESWSFDEFNKKHNYRDEIKEILDTSNTIEELMTNPKWDNLQIEILEDVSNYRHEKFYEAVDKAMKKLGYTRSLKNKVK